MARVRVVTRTIENVVVTVSMSTLVDGKEVNEIKDLNLGNVAVTRENVLKITRKMFEKGDVTINRVWDMKKVQQIYGMLETDFIRLASPMNDERKFITADGTEISADETETDEPTEDEKPNKSK